MTAVGVAEQKTGHYGVSGVQHSVTEEHRWCDHLPDLFARVKIDRFGMASIADRSSTTVKGMTSNPSFTRHVRAMDQSAVDYWNGFKEFEHGSANRQILDYLKAYHDFALQIPNLDAHKAKLFYNKLYQRFFMSSAPYEEARMAAFSTLEMKMNKCAKKKKSALTIDRKIQKQNELIKNAAKRGKKGSQAAAAAQEEFGTLGTVKLTLLRELAQCTNQIDGLFDALRAPVEFPPPGGSPDPTDPYAFFPWWICPKPWEQPCSDDEQLAELNSRWAADLAEIKGKWESLIRDLHPRNWGKRFMETLHHNRLRMESYDHYTSLLNLKGYSSGKAKEIIDEYGKQWAGGMQKNNKLWLFMEKVCEKDLFGPRWDEYNAKIYPQHASHAQYENIMNADYFQPLLRRKTSHYHHNHIAHEYNGYANGYSRAVVPYDGHTQIESEASVLGIVTLFIIGFVVCFIWWMLCAVTGYHLVSKETKKKQDVENQLEFVAN